VAQGFIGVRMSRHLRTDLEGLASRESTTISALVRRLIESAAKQPLADNAETREDDSAHEV
jgi:hypothetical protein